jgi:hypothetical protein
MIFNYRYTPGPVLAIAASLCLGAVSAVVIGLIVLLAALLGGINGHGIPPWFLLAIAAHGLIWLGGAVCFISVPMALALLVNSKSARNRQNIILIAFGCLYAFGATAVFLSKLTN